MYKLEQRLYFSTKTFLRTAIRNYADTVGIVCTLCVRFDTYTHTLYQRLGERGVIVGSLAGLSASIASATDTIVTTTTIVNGRPSARGRERET